MGRRRRIVAAATGRVDGIVNKINVEYFGLNLGQTSGAHYAKN